MSTHTIRVSRGSLEFIYADELVPLLTLGTADVKRVSHVEPAPLNGSIGWIATMVETGEVLGPFVTRQEALDAEVAHLQRERGL